MVFLFLLCNPFSFLLLATIPQATAKHRGSQIFPLNFFSPSTLLGGFLTYWPPLNTMIFHVCISRQDCSSNSKTMTLPAYFLYFRQRKQSYLKHDVSKCNLFSSHTNRESLFYPFLAGWSCHPPSCLIRTQRRHPRFQLLLGFHECIFSTASAVAFI